MQWEKVELNMLKKDKNRKYSWPRQLTMYSQTVEGTIYLTDLSRTIRPWDLSKLMRLGFKLHPL
jgi:hypothetical protein